MGSSSIVGGDLEGGLWGTTRLDALGGMSGGNSGGCDIGREVVLSRTSGWPPEATISCPDTGLVQLVLGLGPEASFLTTVFSQFHSQSEEDEEDPILHQHVPDDGVVSLLQLSVLAALDLSFNSFLDPLLIDHSKVIRFNVLARSSLSSVEGCFALPS